MRTQTACRVLWIVCAIVVGTSFDAWAQLRVCNKTTMKVFVSVAYASGGERWVSEGWSRLKPGACSAVVAGALKNRYYYVFAETGDRNSSWGGRYNFCVARPEPFKIFTQDCAPHNYDTAGFFQVDTGDSSSVTQSLTSSAEPAPTSWNAAAKSKLASIGADRLGSDWVLTSPLYTGQLDNGTEQSKSLTLADETDYLAIGICDNECSDIDFELFDSLGIEIDSDTGPNDLPVVQVEPESTSTYRLRILMASCSQNPCRYAVGVFAKSSF